jgi:tRNA threonylcarbamoyladenosine biosynthesis protein TsaE
MIPCGSPPSTTSREGAGSDVPPGALTRTTLSLAETERLGSELARLFPPPAIVLLSGPLGVGKTTLIQAWLHALGVRDVVKSPTFDLVHRHEWPGGVVYHVDLYRLDPPPAPEALDVPMNDPSALVLVEWGAAWQQYAPAWLELTLSFGPSRASHSAGFAAGEDEPERQVVVTRHGR